MDKNVIVTILIYYGYGWYEYPGLGKEQSQELFDNCENENFILINSYVRN